MSKRSFHLVVLPGLALTAGSLQNRIEGSDARAKCFFMSDVLDRAGLLREVSIMEVFLRR